MAVFHYLACTMSGEFREGELEAGSSREAARVLRGQTMRVLRMKELRERKGWRSLRLPHFISVSQKHAAFFCRQVAVMSEVQPIHEILSAMEQQGGDKAYVEMIRDVRKSVELGQGLAVSLKKYEDIFSPSAIHLIAAGEASGNLQEILGRLADYIEREFSARKKFESALFYPMILAICAMAALAVMLLFILPSFVGLLEGMHTALPLPTRILLFLGKFLSDYGPFLFLGVAASGAGLWYLYGRESLRLPVDRFLLRLPFWGDLRKQVVWMHVLGTLSVLLRGGLQMDEALSMAGKVTENRALQVAILESRRSVQHGYSLTAALKGTSLFPGMLLQLLAAGECSGRMEEMLEKASEYCRLSAESKFQRLQALMEPALILIMGGVVMLFVLAIVLPILESMESIA